jgi:hypothetical protein
MAVSWKRSPQYNEGVALRFRRDRRHLAVIKWGMIFTAIASLVTSGASAQGRIIAKVQPSTCHMVNGRKFCQDIRKSVVEIPQTSPVDSAGNVYEPIATPPPQISYPQPSPPLGGFSYIPPPPPPPTICYVPINGQVVQGCQWQGYGPCQCSDNVGNVYSGSAQ